MKTLDLFAIAGRSAIVTGAASGIGLAYAEVMAEAGASVTLSDIDGAAAAIKAEQLRRRGHRVRAAQLDVVDRDATRAVIDAHVSAFGSLNIAFANAGVDTGIGFWNPAGRRNNNGQIDTLDPAHWDQTIAINLTGVFNTIREAARVMKADRKGGSIIATSSNAALITAPMVGLAYMPAKAGVAHLVRSAALELAEYRIRVNAIAPGPFLTNIGGGGLKNDPAIRKAWDAQVPLGSMAETDQIKPLALLLASDASSYMTGAHVVIDGGMMLGKFAA
jgi:NAD(P)-dependent dehydrogenase (short-subunit alcohol dehydrogenase family)